MPDATTTSTLAPTHKPALRQQLRALPAVTLRPLQQAGEMVALLLEVTRSAITKPTGYWGDVREQMFEILKLCWFPMIVSCTAFGMGAPGLQGGNLMLMFGMPERLGSFFMMASVREFAPWINAMVVAGVMGTAITADLGARRIREEFDAMEVLGVDPVRTMVLSYSRDPFCCYTTSMDMGVFWDCHRRGFAHFGGVPGSIVYDRTKTVVRRHVAPGKAVPLHPEAVAFAGHYGFDIDVLAAYRPTGKGRVERQVEIVRDHVLAGRSFDSIEELDAAFTQWVPIRRRQVHRTHGEVIGVRAARDHDALRAVAATPYLVADRHLRRVGKDCLISFAASLYSTPARLVRPGQTVDVRVNPTTVAIHRITPFTGGDRRGSTLLAVHPRATERGSWVIDPRHWDGLPNGAGRATTTTTDRPDEPAPYSLTAEAPVPLATLFSRAATRVMVSTRPLATYDQAAGLTPTDQRPRVVS